jgi:TolB-like protein/Tfp pilus assembly protein PilF
MNRFSWRTLAASVTGLPGQLRSRGVFRTGLAYLVASGVIVQVSAAAFPALTIPTWVLSLEILFLALGLPVAVGVAWSVGVPPRNRDWHGTATLDPGGGGDPSLSPRASWGAGPRIVQTRDAPVSSATRSPAAPAIAALPFLDRSPDGSHQFLGDGVADELIGVLARMPGLRVVARTSSFQFRDGVADVREIAHRLGVDFLLEGSVRVVGDRMRMTAQLIEASAGTVVWAGSCERTLVDLIEVQQGLAREVVGALCGHLGQSFCPPNDLPGRSSGGSGNPAAHKLYLRGRARWNERTPHALHQAIRYFERALALDPLFAQAHAGIADAHSILTDHGIVPPSEGLARARLAAAEAIRLAPDLSEARMAEALVRQLEGDWAGAEGEFRAAIALNPALAPARQRLALLLAWTGRPDEAREVIRDALAIDPLSPAVAVSEGWIEYYARDLDCAQRRLEDAVKDYPWLESARCGLGLVHLSRGNPMQAVEVLQKAPEVGASSGAQTALLSHALARSGRVPEAREWADALGGEGGSPPLSPYYRAVVHLGFEEWEQALAALEEAVAEGAPQRAYLGVEPIFDSLRGLPRFTRILEECGFTSRAYSEVGGKGALREEPHHVILAPVAE